MDQGRQLPGRGYLLWRHRASRRQGRAPPSRQVTRPHARGLCAFVDFLQLWGFIFFMYFQVCGLAWSPDGRILASGGNDNILNLWQAVSGECFGSCSVSHVLSQHQAAVKALAWCPWQPNILASGGGTAHRTVGIWNASNGALLNTVDTKSQVG